MSVLDTFSMWYLFPLLLFNNYCYISFFLSIERVILLSITQKMQLHVEKIKALVLQIYLWLYLFSSLSVPFSPYLSATSATLKQSIKCKMEIKYLSFRSATVVTACSIPCLCTALFEIKWLKVGLLHKMIFLYKLKVLSNPKHWSPHIGIFWVSMLAVVKHYEVVMKNKLCVNMLQEYKAFSGILGAGTFWTVSWLWLRVWIESYHQFQKYPNFHSTDIQDWVETFYGAWGKDRDKDTVRNQNNLILKRSNSKENIFR